MKDIQARVLLEVERSVYRVFKSHDIIWLEAEAHGTILRTERVKSINVRGNLGSIMPKLEPYGFMRIHRNHAVNLSHIYEIRRRSEGRDWEITLDGPQGQILPIGRSYLSQLWDAYKPSLAID